MDNLGEVALDAAPKRSGRLCTRRVCVRTITAERRARADSKVCLQIPLGHSARAASARFPNLRLSAAVGGLEGQPGRRARHSRSAAERAIRPDGVRLLQPVKSGQRCERSGSRSGGRRRWLVRVRFRRRAQTHAAACRLPRWTTSGSGIGRSESVLRAWTQPTAPRLSPGRRSDAITE